MANIPTSILPPTMDSHAENQLQTFTKFSAMAEKWNVVQKIPTEI